MLTDVQFMISLLEAFLTPRQRIAISVLLRVRGPSSPLQVRDMDVALDLLLAQDQASEARRSLIRETIENLNTVAAKCKPIEELMAAVEKIEATMPYSQSPR